ncbi:MAG TPA: YfhO family protein [candidate division Zixibacteria bacterium]|nr:YfhO family protein [candidate division Zixibacteria bacterium]
MTWSLEPLSLVNLLISDKEPDPSAPSGLKLFFARGTPFFVSYYMGAAAICGVWFWLLLDSWRPKLPLAVLIGVTLVLALGSHTPLYPFLYTHLWFLGALRFPEKFFYITQLLLLYAALKGFVLFLDRDEPGSRRKGLAVAALSVACMATYVYFRFHSEIVARGVSARAGVAPGSGIQSEITAAVLAGIERQTVLIVGVLLLFWLASKNVIRRLLFGALLAAVAFVDLAWTHRGLLFPLDPGFLSNGFRILPRPDPSLNRLFYYPAPHNLHPSRFVVHGRRSFEETTALFSRYLLPNEGILHGFDYFQEIDALARWPYSEFLAFANPLDASTQTRLLRSFNVRYVVAFQPLTAGGLVLLARFPGDHAWLYEIQEPVPRAYVVGHSVAESRARRVLERLASPGFDPRAEVILNAEAPLGERRAAAASARIVSYGSRSVTVQASLDGAGILVLADSYYPGWKAYVDGKEAEIYRANLFFRAVPLGAGEHVVEFKYEPRSFRLGLIVSMTTLLVLAAISLGVWRRNRRRALDAAAHGTG